MSTAIIIVDIITIVLLCVAIVFVTLSVREVRNIKYYYGKIAEDRKRVEEALEEFRRLRGVSEKWQQVDEQETRQ